MDHSYEEPWHLEVIRECISGFTTCTTISIPEIFLKNEFSQGTEFLILRTRRVKIFTEQFCQCAVGTVVITQ